MEIDGKELRISLSSFSEGMALKRAIGRAVRGENLNFDIGAIDLDSILDDVDSEFEISERLVGSFLNSIINLGISKEIEKHFFICAERALLGEDKIDRDFFEEEENRQYYYPILIEVIKVNLRPFFKRISLLFPDVGEKVKKYLKRKSKQK